MNIAVILAGGSGVRLGASLPKQFLKVAGKKIIEHSIDVFEKNCNIDEIAIVCKEEFIPEVEALVIQNEYKKVKKILQGGKERYHSSLSAINAYPDDNCNLIFHDSVRPLVTDRIIDDCIEALKQHQAVDVAIKSTDTIIAVDHLNHIASIPARETLRNGQTPQCFKRGIIKRAYDMALNDPHFQTTDDCGVVRKYLPEIPIYVVDGEVSNMKLTHVEDWFLLDKLFQLRTCHISSTDISASAAAGLPNKILVVFGGSYGIGEEVVKLAEELGITVYSFSRSANGVDVCDMAAVEESLKNVHAQHGKIDYVVNTAGILIKEPLCTMAPDDILRSVSVNYLGTVNVARAAFPYLKETKGSLLFYTSSSYTKGRMMYSIYSSTKAAIVNFVQALSEEWYHWDIKVNCINPERCKTPMRVKSFGVEPEHTLLDPRDVAIASINTLCSKLTGTVVDVKRRQSH